MVSGEDPSRDVPITGAELQSVVEPTLEPLSLRTMKPAPQSLLQQWVVGPLKYWAVVVTFLSIIFYMLAITLAQGIGMIAMSTVMPYLMTIVYPTRIGQIHTTFLAWYRRWFIGKGGH